MESGEDPPSGLTLKVHPPSDGAVVLAAGLVQVDSGHLPGRKVDFADVGDASGLGPVDPDALPHHQILGVVVQNNIWNR